MVQISPVKAVSIVAVAFFFAVACGDVDYSAENFSYFESLAERNPEGAVDELRYFVHQNPEHAPGLLLLSRLLAEQATDDRELYLARHYVQQAISHSEDEAVREEAEGEYLQIRIRQDTTPGDTGALVELADFAEDNERYEEATEFLLQASFEHVGAQEYGDAFSTLEDARDLLDAHAPEEEAVGDQWLQLREDSDHLMVILGFLENELTASLDAASAIERRGDSEPHESLPHPELVSATIEALDVVAGGSWMPWPGSGGDEETVSASELIENLEQADELNQVGGDVTRLRLSARLFDRLREDAEEGDAADAVREYAEERLEYYRSSLEEQDLDGDLVSG